MCILLQAHATGRPPLRQRPSGTRTVYMLAPFPQKIEPVVELKAPQSLCAAPTIPLPAVCTSRTLGSHFLLPFCCTSSPRYPSSQPGHISAHLRATQHQGCCAKPKFSIRQHASTPLNWRPWALCRVCAPLLLASVSTDPWNTVAPLVHCRYPRHIQA